MLWLCKVIFSFAPCSLWVRRWADSAKCRRPSAVVTQTLYVLKLSLYVRYILFKGNNEHEITGRLGPSKPEALTTRREVEEMKREEREATWRIPSVVQVSFNHCFFPPSPPLTGGQAALTQVDSLSVWSKWLRSRRESYAGLTTTGCLNQNVGIGICCLCRGFRSSFAASRLVFRRPFQQFLQQCLKFIPLCPTPPPPFMRGYCSCLPLVPVTCCLRL